MIRGLQSRRTKFIAGTITQLPYLGPTNRATDGAKARPLDALEWLSYIHKPRDKLKKEWEKQGQIFSASRPKRDNKVAAIFGTLPTILGTISSKVESGDSLLDTTIGTMQYIYRLSQASKIAASSQ